MSRKRTGRRNTRALNARLDNELDLDLIEWLNAQPAGRRSEAIRNLLRDGLRLQEQRTELADVVRQTIAEALENVQFVASQHGVEINTNQMEDAFGSQLDQLLDRFG